MRFGGLEILLVVVIVVLLFGPGRLAKVAKELGSSITAFRSGLKEKDSTRVEEEKSEDQDQTR